MNRFAVLSSAPGQFSQRSRIGIVFEESCHAKSVLELGGQVTAFPARQELDPFQPAGQRIDRPGAAHADPFQVPASFPGSLPQHRKDERQAVG